MFIFRFESWGQTNSVSCPIQLHYRSQGSPCRSPLIINRAKPNLTLPKIYCPTSNGARY